MFSFHWFISFMVLGAILFVILWWVPLVLPRLLSGIISTLIYPRKVFNAQKIPAQGGALLICNQVSYLDPFLIFGAFRRPVRFLTDRQLYNVPIFHRVCLRSHAIPIDRKMGPREILRAFAEVRRALASGELVCIFPEGVLTPTGGLLEFHKGFEVIMKKVDVPIIPIFIDLAATSESLWGKFPKARYPVSVLVGSPLPADTNSDQARTQIEALSLEANDLRHRWRKPLSLSILDKLKKHPFKLCVADARGQKVCYLRFFSIALAWSRQIFSLKSDASDLKERIGIMLPTSSVAAIVHVAIALAGKIPVHLEEPSCREDVELWLKRYGLRQVVTSRASLNEYRIDPNPGMIFLDDFQKVGGGMRSFVYDALVLLAPRWFLIRFFIKGVKATMDDVATVVPSGGDGYSSPGVMLTHGNIAAQIESLTKTFAVKANDVVVGLVPFSRVFGLLTSLYFPLGNGLGVVYASEKSGPQPLGVGLKAFQGSIVFLKLSFLPEFLHRVSPEQAVQVRKVVVEKGMVPESWAWAFRKKFGVFPLEVYGADKRSSIVSVGLPVYVSSAEMEQQLGHLAGRIGYPVQGVVVNVVDPVTFAPVAPGEEGLLLVSGGGVMKGYDDDPRQADGSFHQGWFITGDMAKIDETGCFAILKMAEGGLSGYDSQSDHKIHMETNLCEEKSLGSVFDGKR